MEATTSLTVMGRGKERHHRWSQRSSQKIPTPTAKGNYTKVWISAEKKIPTAVSRKVKERDLKMGSGTSRKKMDWGESEAE